MNVIIRPVVMIWTSLNGPGLRSRVRNRIVSLAPARSLAVPVITSQRARPMVWTAGFPSRPSCPVLITLAWADASAVVRTPSHTTRCAASRSWPCADERAIGFRLLAVHDTEMNIVAVVLTLLGGSRSVRTNDATDVVALGVAPELRQPDAPNAKSTAVPASSVRPASCAKPMPQRHACRPFHVEARNCCFAT